MIDIVYVHHRDLTPPAHHSFSGSPTSRPLWRWDPTLTIAGVLDGSWCRQICIKSHIGSVISGFEGRNGRRPWNTSCTTIESCRWCENGGHPVIIWYSGCYQREIKSHSGWTCFYDSHTKAVNICLACHRIILLAVSVGNNELLYHPTNGFRSKWMPVNPV